MDRGGIFGARARTARALAVMALDHRRCPDGVRRRRDARDTTVMRPRLTGGAPAGPPVVVRAVRAMTGTLSAAQITRHRLDSTTTEARGGAVLLARSSKLDP